MVLIVFILNVSPCDLVFFYFCYDGSTFEGQTCLAECVSTEKSVSEYKKSVWTCDVKMWWCDKTVETQWEKGLCLLLIHRKPR